MTFDLLDPKSMLVGAFAIVKNHSRELKSGNHGSGAWWFCDFLTSVHIVSDIPYD